MLPTVGLSANVGRQYLNLLETLEADTWSVSGSVSVPILGGGRSWASVRAARAERDANAFLYSQASLAATQEVEASLAQEQRALAQLQAYEAQIEAAELTFEESKVQYLAGLTSHLSVLSSLQSLQQVQLTVLQARRDLIGTRIQLHQTLGGGHGPTPGPSRTR